MVLPSPAPLALVGLALLAGAAAQEGDEASSPEPEPPPRIEHVVIVSMDTTRRDRLGFHGGPARTPSLDALAGEGAVFESAFAPTPVTLPSNTTLLTGLLPPRHGVRDNGIFRVAPEVVTLAEVLGNEGFHTAAFVSAFVLDGQFGLGRGFDLYDDRFQSGYGGMLGLEERSATATTDAALRWLDAREGGRFFLFVHYFDPHHPYDAPEPFASEAEHPYDAELAYMDSEIGRLARGLRSRGLLDESLLVLTSDHGEALGEHGERTHGIFVYDATMAVPLVFRGPGIAGGARLGGNVSLADVMPTVLELLGLPIGQEIQGRSLAPALLEGLALEERPVWLEAWSGWYSFGWAPLTALVVGDHKYISAPRPELYDLSRDPGETVNLFEREPERARAMERRLAALRAELETGAARHEGTGAGQDDAEPALSDEDRARLSDLGYASSIPQAGSSDRDPKDALFEFELLQRAGAAQERGDFEEAIRLYDRILEQNPRNFTALERAGMALLQVSRHAEAVAKLEQIRLFPGLPMFSLAQAHARLGREERALELVDEIRRKNPKFMPAHLFYARYHEARGETAAALEAYQALLANWFGESAFRAQIQARARELRAELEAGEPERPDKR